MRAVLPYRAPAYFLSSSRTISPIVSRLKVCSTCSAATDLSAKASKIRCLFARICMIRSSMVSVQSGRWTKTSLVCPMRYAREIAWFSIDDLNCGSHAATAHALSSSPKVRDPAVLRSQGGTLVHLVGKLLVAFQAPHLKPGEGIVSPMREAIKHTRRTMGHKRVLFASLCNT